MAGQLKVLTGGRWSGGGNSVLRNLSDLAAEWRSKGDDATLLPRNVGSIRTLPTSYIHMPQNALGWSEQRFPDIPRQRRIGFKLATEAFLRRARGVIPITSGVPFAVGEPIHNVLDRSFDEALEHLPVSPGDTKKRSDFVVLGQMGSYKNTRMLIEGYQLYRYFGGSRPIALVGQARPSVREDLQLLRAKFPDCYVRAESVQRLEALALMRDSHAVLMPSLCEASPVTVLEALALGKPVGLSSIAAHQEIVRGQGGSVQFFDPNSAEAVAHALSVLDALNAETASPSALVSSEYRAVERRRWQILMGSRIDEILELRS